MIKFFLISALLLMAAQGFCQRPPEEFFTGLEQYQKKDFDDAKRNFLIAAQKAPAFNGTYHFLGVLCFNADKPDSAIWYFKKSIDLNKGNVNHSREMTYSRLIITYTYQRDFKNGFNSAWEALQQYPDNKTLNEVLRNLCLWAFYINDNGLNPAYCSSHVRDEYVVKAVDEEYLILRNLTVDGEYLQMESQALVDKKSGPYDVFKCSLSDSKKEVELDFKIDWDMNKYYGGISGPTQPVADDKNKPVYERLGAMLAANSKTDVKTAIESLQK